MAVTRGDEPLNRRRLLYVIPLIAIGAVIAFWLSGNGSEDPPSPIVAAVVVADSEFDACLECHDDLDASIVAGSVQLIGFAHQNHFSASGDVGCGTCHGLDTHDRTPPQAPEMDDCFSCHIDEGPAPAFPCLQCHDSTMVPPPQSHFTSEWSGLHSSAAKINQSLCETCHSREAFCAACHGVEIPHEDGWAGYPHARDTFNAGIESCSRCHPRGPELATRDECDACHHPQNPDVPIWRDAHPEVVRDQGGRTCFECHDPNTCVACHTRDVEDFSADLRRLEPPPAAVDETADDESGSQQESSTIDETP